MLTFLNSTPVGSVQQQMQATAIMPSQVNRVPLELLCRIDNKLMKDAVLVPCCGKSFCRECTYYHDDFLFLSILSSLRFSQKMWSYSILFVSILHFLVRDIFSRSSRINHSTRITGYLRDGGWEGEISVKKPKGYFTYHRWCNARKLCCRMKFYFYRLTVQYSPTRVNQCY